MLQNTNGSLCKSAQSYHIAGPYETQRYAIKTDGYLGSLYDGWNDNVVRNFHVTDYKSIHSHLGAQCKLVKGDSAESQNLLKMIGVDDNLRMSIVLNLARIDIRGLGLLKYYNGSSNTLTRFIHYRRVDRDDCLYDDIRTTKSILLPILISTRATHIITGIKWGIDVLIILQIPSMERVSSIDSVLQKLCDFLRGIELQPLSINEREIIRNLKPVLYTNINIIQHMMNCNLYDICLFIRDKVHLYPYTVIPLLYMMRPVSWFYPDYQSEDIAFYDTDISLVEKIETYIHIWSTNLGKLNLILEQISSKKLSGYLLKNLQNVSEQLSAAQHMFLQTKIQLGFMLAKMRQGKIEGRLFDEELTKRRAQLDESIRCLADHVSELSDKVQLINDLQTIYNLKYCNVVDLGKLDDDEHTVDNKLLALARGEQTQVLYATDALKKSNEADWSQLCKELSQSKSIQRPIYADFSYCSFKLVELKVLPLTNEQLPPQMPLPEKSSSEINVLLLGETGVGKSTFINAFVNYLTFDSLDQARTSKPTVLIPVSFLITINDKFDEFHVKFGDVDVNEDHEHQGQSVTQQCKSYVFDIDDRVKLRIIDTPGIGDTRGLVQDDINIQQILSYINNLSHLNAICILLKPNASRINVFFRLCFTQLFDFLGPSVRDNIIFCFTNARSTFFAPGNTVPLLKELLKELPVDKIPFNKKNTFCFDSESFRYLAAVSVLEKMPSFDYQKQEYEQSWINSVVESSRLLNFIRQLKEYPMKRWQSAKHVQLEILLLVRPMLETMRNIIRNSILIEKKMKSTIELRAQSISQPSSLCTTCQSQKIVVENFWLVPDQLHKCSTELNGCGNCHCSLSKHVPVYYQLSYESSSSSQSDQDLAKMWNTLMHAIKEFTHFFLRNIGTSHSPFLPGIKRFINEEERRCLSRPSHYFNEQLLRQLIDLKQTHKKCSKEMQLRLEYTDLKVIYNMIEQVQTLPTVSEQIVAVRASQLDIAKQHEYQVPKRQTGSSTTTSL